VPGEVAGSAAMRVEHVLAGVRPATTSAKNAMTAGTTRQPTKPWSMSA